jgi:hypothetical protein
MARSPGSTKPDMQTKPPVKPLFGYTRHPGSLWGLHAALSLVAGLLLFMASPLPVAAQSAPAREYQVKAVFLFNFLQFVEWPATVFPDERSPIRIGVLGDDPFGPALEEAIRDETINQRRLVVTRSHRVEDLRDCHLVFISKSENRRINTILPLLNNHPVLTVSEVDGFARQGGVIAFYQDGKKVRFEINVGMAQRLGLKMSSELLRLGKIVGQESLTGDFSR